jgi:hypothetical protein
MFLFGTIFVQIEVNNHATCAILRRTPSVVDVKAKIKPKTYVLFEKKSVLKFYKTKFLSCNLKGCAVLRRIPSVVDVKAKIKLIIYVFVCNNFRTKRS